MKNYFIVSTGRGRSGALNYSLNIVGCGKPNDYFLAERWDTYKNGINGLGDFLESKRVNGFLGIRTVWQHIRDMHKFTGLKLKEFMDTYMLDAKFIFVTRDPLRQTLEGMYIYYERHPDYKVPDALFIEKEKVETRLSRIIYGYAAWELFFETHNIEPYRLRVDDLVAAPEIIVPSVCQFLEYELPKNARLTEGFKDRYSTLPVIEELYDIYMKDSIRFIYNENHNT